MAAGNAPSTHAATQAALREHAFPLAALSSLAYIGARDLRSWPPELLSEVSDCAAKSHFERARELLKPFITEGEQPPRNSDIRLIGELFSHVDHASATMDVHDAGSGLDVYMLTTRERIAVVYAGTYDEADIFADLGVVKVDVRDGSLLPVVASCQPCCGNDIIGVHGGFWRQYKSKRANERIIAVVLEKLKDNPDMEVVISGHSLGASLSVLLGFELAQTVDNQVIVLNFACPRVGNYGFRNACNALQNLNVIRVKYEDDPITALPAYNYKHVGKLVWLRSGAATVFDDEPWGQVWYMLPYAWKLSRLLPGLMNISDHKMDNYLRSMSELWPLLDGRLGASEKVTKSESFVIAARTISSRSTAESSLEAGLFAGGAVSSTASSDSLASKDQPPMGPVAKRAPRLMQVAAQEAEQAAGLVEVSV